MCTCLRVKARDKSIVIGRTMEFGIDPSSRITVFPRNFKYETQGANNKPGFSWSGKYGFVGMDMFGLPMVSDGINEKGLYVGDLYLPGFAEYQLVPAGEEDKSITPVDVAGYILSQCENVDEVVKLIKGVYVWPWYADQLKSIPPLHYAVHDASGKSVVIEYIKGELKIHENPIGVLTNSPDFDWHMINLRNFVNLSATNVPLLKLEGDTLIQIGQGSGMLGLPGDSTPPSRFVRATAFTQSLVQPEDSKGAVNAVYHIMNNFDIPIGFAKSMETGKPTYDFTFWTTFSDLTNREYYYRGYDNVQVYKISLIDINFNEEKIRHLEFESGSWFKKIS